MFFIMDKWGMFDACVEWASANQHGLFVHLPGDGEVLAFVCIFN
jgi:hypothetical protein